MRRRPALAVAFAIVLAAALGACATTPVGTGGIVGAPIDGGGGQSGDIADGAVADAGPADGGGPDTGAPDTGTPDTGAPDAGIPDTGIPDTGAPDTGPADTGPQDTGGGGGSCVIPPIATYSKDPNVNRINKLQLLDEKTGCDLDNDGAPNNVAGKIVGIYAAANDALKDAVNEGSIVILLRPTSWQTNGAAFDIELLLGDLDPANSSCKPGTQTCDYAVDTASFNTKGNKGGSCPPLVTFTPATVNSSQLKAGGNQQIFQLNLPVVGINLDLKISQAQLSGTVSDPTSWKSTKEGMLCGVINKDDLEKAIDAVPDEVLKETGFDKATIKALIGGVLKPDIDTDGNNQPDAISIALGIETTAAKVTTYK